MTLPDYAVTDPSALTPWENRNGRWYKREDYHRNAYGVNGAKYRACRHMMVKAKEAGYDSVVSAQSVLSPQSPIVATLAEELEMECFLVYGASNPISVVKHRNVAIAVEAGAHINTEPRVAYNGVIQPYAAKLAEDIGAWQLPYAISMPEDASEADLRAFLAVGGAQIENTPYQLETLVISFGSGNTTAGVLYGLGSSKSYLTDLKQIVLVGVGPDRTEWLFNRLAQVGVTKNDLPRIRHMPLHGWFADYADKMPETVDDIVMHPTYEGKAVRFLNQSDMYWWHDRECEDVGFWIVGGPL